MASSNFVLTHPGVQGLRNTADLLGDRFDSSPLRRMLGLVLLHHAHGAFTDLGRKLGDFFMAPFSSGEAFAKPEVPQIDVLINGASHGMRRARRFRSSA